VQAVIFRCAALSERDGGLNFIREGRPIPKDTQPNTVVPHGSNFALQVLQKKTHQSADFVTGAGPIFGAEGVKGDVADIPLHTSLSDAPDLCRPLRVTSRAREKPFLCPPPIAIHDECDMLHSRVIGRLHEYSVSDEYPSIAQASYPAQGLLDTINGVYREAFECRVVLFGGVGFGHDRGFKSEFGGLFQALLAAGRGANFPG